MSIIRRILGRRSATEQSRTPFRVGDRVHDPWGNKHTVTQIEPGGENGQGTIGTRADTGGESVHAMIAHGLTLLSAEESGFSPANNFAVERVKLEESCAGAYLRAGKILFCGSCITNYGGLDCGPCRSLDATASDAEVGTALLSILAAARTTPVPADLKQDLKPVRQELFRLAGVRSSAKFNDGAAYCNIWQTPSDISINPSHNEGRGYSFLGRGSSIRLSTASEPEQIGKALRVGFSRCT